MELSRAGKDVLRVLLEHIKTHQVEARRPETFIGYKAVHDILKLPLMADTYGDSLSLQGLGDLAEWTLRNNFPAITGLVIDTSLYQPGKGYFQLFGKDRDDFKWWREEIEKVLSFDWERFLGTPKEEPTEAQPEQSAQIVELETPQALDFAEPDETIRVLCKTYRILRDTLLARKVKSLHQYRCQICGTTISLQNERLYAEAHHIRPLGAPHDGPDISQNILCVCPNHHVQLDYGAIRLEKWNLRILPEHDVGDEYIDYHNREIFGKAAAA